MKSGDVFTLDAQAIEETAKFTKVDLGALQKKLSEGDEFSISKSDKLNTNVIRGVRWVDGKPRKGRPRRFPRATVARLLGFDDSAFEAAQTAQQTAVVQQTAEEAANLESRAEELLETPAETPAETAEVASDDDLSW